MAFLIVSVFPGTILSSFPSYSSSRVWLTESESESAETWASAATAAATGAAAAAGGGLAAAGSGLAAPVKALRFFGGVGGLSLLSELRPGLTEELRAQDCSELLEEPLELESRLLLPSLLSSSSDDVT